MKPRRTKFETDKDKLRQIIRKALETATNFDEFSELLLRQGIELKKEREQENGQPSRKVYGKYENVFLTDTELSELQKELPDKWEHYIDRLSWYMASKGTTYNNHSATILTWAARDAEKIKSTQGIPEYVRKDGESL